METSILLGLYWYNRKENGNYCSILGLYWDSGKENGNCRSVSGLMENRTETTVS